ncbi:hypothetical protein C5B89_16945 [Haloferax sp. Atlit-47N]|nr:hypothetical protein [Haloferax sp. AS1]RDZ30706.1 hypothetical protein DEQ67_14155 [Haloferax sp. Atlit-48N]RDZ33744.1 hypothetical protein C5B88_18320 [Haloferax sp. Atlit-24N]RDZ35932.1 hypothetical protein C5B89_16945 [Haloferax sp. Atlit-47N]RLM34266.1 hypothetical protein DVK03_17100 [Haloferax sp. Atlit-109R]RLM41087.1 hypothetical protein DVK04_16915 [Haloferax sp. Atlit-105R]
MTVASVAAQDTRWVGGRVNHMSRYTTISWWEWYADRQRRDRISVLKSRQRSERTGGSTETLCSVQRDVLPIESLADYAPVGHSSTPDNDGSPTFLLHD